MTIDANALFGMWSIRTPGIDDPDEFVRHMDGYGIDKSIIVALSGMVFDTIIGNGDTIEACEAHPDRLMGLCVVNPKTDMTDPLQQMDRCREAGLVGLRLTPQHGYSYSDVELLSPVIERAAQYDWPVWVSLVVVQNTPFGSQPVTAVGPLLDAYPDVPFIVTGTGYGGRLEAMRVLRDRPNAWMDIGTMQCAFGVDRLCEDLGAQKVILGTGFAINHYGITMAKLETADISDEQKDMIRSGNITRILQM
ncbi:MAG: amidohydrolase family protein [Armatimonadota bacterium]